MPRASPPNLLTLKLYLLGAFRLERDSKRVNFSTRKIESLLAYLALFPEPHAREKLAALLWGDSTDEQARHSLRTALAAIRKELGEEILIADRESVQLNPAVTLWVDAREFERIADSKSQIVESPDAISHLQSAISHYADLLPDFYDEWIIRERERLRAIYVDALLQLAQHYRSASDYTRAIETAQKILATDRANEKAHQTLMFCFAAQGDRIAALKQYDECKKILREDLNAEPSSETTALRDQIMQELTGAPSREASLTNLPNPLTSFVGREKEIEEIKRYLSPRPPSLAGKGESEGVRLLTLSGAGGCGKTRLAIQIAREAADAKQFKHGVWWVELAALNDPALVPQSVANVFDLRETPDTPLLKLLANFLREKDLLLILDNCEHLIDACAQLAQMLLSASPKLQIIATSREALNVTGEIIWRVPSLAVPDAEHLPPLDQLTQYDAIKLFVQRATAIAPNWKLDGNARAVAQICARLDGIPLALELAAARLKTLSAEQIAARLDDRFNLLTSGSRTALLRQQTLRAAIDWSYDLLSEQERALLRRLSVFAGGWTLEAAEEIANPNSQDPKTQIGSWDLGIGILDLLSRLVDKSLVIVEQQGGEARYRLLETIRQYARDKLLETGESETIRNHHLDYFLKFAEEAEPKLKTAEQTEWLDRLEVEHNNLRAAWDCAIESDAELAGRLASAFYYFWYGRGNPSEGREWLAKLLPRTIEWGQTAKRARLLGVAGWIAYVQQDFASARPLLEEALPIARTAGDKKEIAFVLRWLGRTALRLHDNQAAQIFGEESLLLHQELQDPWEIASSILSVGTVAVVQGDYAKAQELYSECLAKFRELGDNLSAGVVLNHAGELARLQGDYERAGKFYEERIEILRRLRNNQWC